MAVADFSKDLLYEEVGLRRMKDSYLKNGETSPQERLVKICNIFGSNDSHRKRLYKYTSNHWLSLSTPILCYEEDNKYSFPISCYLCYLDDNIPSIISNLSETNFLSVCGGGVSVKIGLRSKSSKSTGSLAHIKTYDSSVLAYKQGSRRGSYAVYMDINHPEIIEFIDMRKPTGDHNIRCMNIHHAINITDDFMKIIEQCTYDATFKDDWDLIDPHTNKVVKTVSARILWQRIIDTRMQTGEPFLCFIDTCNEFMNKYQKEKGMKINQSNLCTEIIVPTNPNRSSLCCLSSLNMEYYDEWKGNEEFIYDVMEMLDNVLRVFINKAFSNNFSRELLDKVLSSAINEKNIGIGLMGFHSYLQKKMVSIESDDAKKVNIEVFSWLKDTTDKCNVSLGHLRGSPLDIAKSNKRFSYTMAVAPTATTSIIMGNTSPSTEPYRANIYRQDTISGSQFNKNKHLNNLLISKGYGPKLIEKIWHSIIMNDGSVQHLSDNLLSKEEKDIFKTFIEIDQLKLVELAADRQQYIDQGQSLNLTFDPDADVSILHKAHFNAWKLKLKTLYYCRSAKVSSADKLVLDDVKFRTCTSCES